MTHPSLVLNTPISQPYLSKVFSFEAEVYDLDAYENVSPGFGQRVWEMIEKERQFQLGRQPK